MQIPKFAHDSNAEVTKDTFGNAELEEGWNRLGQGINKFNVEFNIV